MQLKGIMYNMKRFSKIILLLVLLTSPVVSLYAVSSSSTVSAQTQDTTVVISGQESSSTTTQQIASKLEKSWPWYLTRASGIVALVSLFWLMISGIGQVTGYTFKFLQPITAWATHKALGIAFLGSIFIHIGALFFDKFVPFGLVDIFIPFASNYRTLTIAGVHLGSTYVAMGIISLYLTILIVATSLLVIDKKPRFWKISHLLSYLTMLLVFIHAISIGTDTSSGWVRVVCIIIGLALVVATLHRLRRANTV